MKRIFVVFLSLLASFVLLSAACGGPERKQYTGVGEITPPIDPKKGYTAVFEVESDHPSARFGLVEFTIIFYHLDAPKNFESVWFLGKEDFYDVTTIHKLEPGAIYLGDPTATGTGGPGYTTADEYQIKRIHDKAGVVGMVSTGPDTNGSQMYITLAPAPHLDPFNPDGSPKDCANPAATCRTVVGRILNGLPVVEQLVVGSKIKRVRMVTAAPR